VFGWPMVVYGEQNSGFMMKIKMLKTEMFTLFVIIFCSFAMGFCFATENRLGCMVNLILVITNIPFLLIGIDNK
jgi:hypothetical protein